MIFAYEELRKYIEEDFDRFYKMGFNERQIFPAILNEYEHGTDFCLVENICIHVLLILNYTNKNLNYEEIKGKLIQLMSTKAEKEIKNELGDEYANFMTDWNNIKFIAKDFDEFINYMWDKE